MTEIPYLSTQHGAVRVLSINDAPYNRMSIAFMDELEKEVEEIAGDEATRAVVITGEGTTAFSVGMNLKQLASGARDRGGIGRFLDQRLRVLRAIETMGKPWVATMFGFSLGGGLELPLACHFRLAAETGTQIGLPEADLGSVPGWGGSARLCKTVGRHHALDMILRAKKISGPEAYRIGLVNELCPVEEIKERALALAQELAAAPRMAVKTMLETLVDCEEKTLDELIKLERDALLACNQTPDVIEGMRAFMEKRKPVFNQTT